MKNADTNSIDYSIDWRAAMVEELDKMVAAVEDGDEGAIDDVRDWLNDAIDAGSPEAFVPLMRGYQRGLMDEMEAEGDAT